MSATKDIESVDQPALADTAKPETLVAIAVDGKVAAESSGISLTFSNLEYTVKEKKTGTEKKILSSVSGVVNPGELLAVMGPSGAGKSSFLDGIAGKLTSLKGKVLLNGAEASVQKYSTYVHQDDSLIGCLTVRETLTYAAKFRLPPSTPKANIKTRVDQVMEDFGLTRVADTTVGNALLRGVSGGEKRRVTLAAQLITFPPIVMLDEPTSGLDSAAAFNVIKLIKQIAVNRGITIVATIHQPSSETFQLFDKLLLLANGSTMYFGQTLGALPYFEKNGFALPLAMNPADYYLSIINVDFLMDRDEASETISKLKQNWEDSTHKKELEADIEAKINGNGLEGVPKVGRTNAFHQFAVLVDRNFKTAWKNVIQYWIRIAMYVALALLMGTTWWDLGTTQREIEDRFALMFFSVAFLCFMSVAGIPAFLEDRLTYLRETRDRAYTPLPYAAANFFVSIPFIFLVSLSFSVVCYFMVGLTNDAPHFFVFVGYLFLALLVAESYVVLISAIIPIFVAALAIVAFLNGWFMVVQGYFVQFQNIPIGWQWANRIDYQKYAFEGMILSDFTGLVFTCDPTPTGCDCAIPATQPDGCSFTGEDILASRKYTDIRDPEWAVVLIGMILVLRVVFWGVLVLKSDKRK